MTRRREIEKRMQERALDLLGQDVFVSGVSYLANFVEEEFEDQTGYRREVYLMVKAGDAEHFIKGDTVFVNEEEFDIRRVQIPTKDAVLVNVELKKRA